MDPTGACRVQLDSPTEVVLKSLTLMEEANAGVGDRISELPDSLLHHVLSFFPVKEAARTSILSKRWNYIWATLPYLNLGEGFLDDVRVFDLEGLKKNKQLLELANKIILDRCQQIASIEKLCLRIPGHESPEEEQLLETKVPSPLGRMVDRLISSVAHRGLKELEFKITAYNCLRFYELLPSTIISAKSLNVLSLHGFDMSSLLSVDVKFPSLRKLCLSKGFLEDDIIGKLIAGCPLLEIMQLIDCKELNNIYVRGLLKLKLLELISNPQLYIIDIEAPNIQVLAVEFPSSHCQLNVATCSSLSEVSLTGEFVTERWFNGFISQCLFLKNLSIGFAKSMKNIRISTNTLKKFKLCLLFDLVEAEINAPNLEHFHFEAFTGFEWPVVDVPLFVLPTTVLNAPDLLETELNVVPRRIDDFWYSQLAEFLGHFHHSRTVKLCGVMYEDIIIPKKNRVSLHSPLYGTHNLIFHSRKIMEFSVVKLIEYMLWLSPRAETLSITCEGKYDNDLIVEKGLITGCSKTWVEFRI
ncbi:hypothetical protein M9H77_15348 [Catharanthus roseus]|uniref:Uncharacterized protein n=1 Tax=Catharanthus roseus TaxID=4058 RepID=A0ACC0AYX5_CATRO|nr:hypothetical protein M9H77_15348 [Catharanthus roseus]